MKKLLFLPVIMLSFFMISCSKEKIPESNQANDQSYVLANKVPIQLPGTIAFGKCDNWQITSLEKNEMDITNEYRLLKLYFCPNNTVTLSNDILSYPGNWYFILDKGNPSYLTIDFQFPVVVASERPFSIWSNIEGTWHVDRFSKNYISLSNTQESKAMVIERQKGF